MNGEGVGEAGLFTRKYISGIARIAGIAKEWQLKPAADFRR
jgi:hypothetical protein